MSNLSPEQFHDVLYHGTTEKFKPGDIIQSANSRGVAPIYAGQGEHAYATSSKGVASWFARQAATNGERPGDVSDQPIPRVYEVEPVGAHEPDPDYARSVRSKEGFRVTKRVWSGKRTW